MKHFIVPVIFLIALVALLIYGPIPQDQEYHDFADERILFGIPHFLDVLSNLAFLIPGIWGLVESTRIKNGLLKTIFITIFSGSIFLTFGSGLYHWSPDNFGLMWDRIPIAIIFLSFFTFIIYDVVGKKLAYGLFAPLVLIGVLSVIYWYWTEISGIGDLRAYILVQFFPVIAIPLIIILYKKKINYMKEIYFIFGFFFLAKITEALDEEIYNVLIVVSGHNLKHFFMALSGIYIVLLMKNYINKSSKEK